jgi:hypothetical protein
MDGGKIVKAHDFEVLDDVEESAYARAMFADWVREVDRISLGFDLSEGEHRGQYGPIWSA